MSAEAEESEALLGLLAELGRLDLDLLVRDQDSDEAIQTLQVLREELEVILERADHGRRGLRTRLAAQERELAGQWPGAAAAESLRRLSQTRRALVELDAALQPAQLLSDELRRRCSRRPDEPQAPQADIGAGSPKASPG